MKLLDSYLFNSIGIQKFSPGEIVSIIYRHGKTKMIAPCIHSDIKCPHCGGNDGYKSPAGKESWWVCASHHCRKEAQIWFDQKANRNKYAPVSNAVTRQDRLALCGVPPMLQGACFDVEWKHPMEIKAALQSWLNVSQRAHGFAVLTGARGRGKTYMACCAIEAYTRFNGHTARFLDVVDTKYKWLDEMRSDGPKTLPVKMTQCDLLVIDDVDKVNPSDAFYEFLYLVVNSRYLSGKPTIITTNKSFEELETLLGDSIASRIFASGGLFVEVDGNDLRQ